MSRVTPNGKTPRRSATPSQLREVIDRGGAGDKVAFSDPAAAPLGTDDEAAGTPPSPEQVEKAAAAEARRDLPADSKKGPEQLQGNRLKPGTISLVVLVLIAVLALVAWLA
ncbi:hypothetical protein OB2597_01602 [Pseudooceanicola batsensis HTCC2597]|uniref:Uncharacterized protein n=1 Tax=Pseudooceanicola batsensis (strain ATCC BAA-863 / DSM 15984 / KCTC 12145 / HTCC2597) TaxID=252305 RepID=A3U313_PSEBH|nr:hypothetical protein [Pseudooceanicola batsensis]EAQ01543.1 hypothetical protein OB2597_01602 [Pseudooceanicola batsensis HTCC2597]